MSDPLQPHSDDLREYYASADAEETTLDTLEFRHQAFVDGDGNAVAVRFVNDLSDFIGTLESDAPMDAGETVTFTRGLFSASQPDQPSSGMPEFTLEVENVSKVLMPYLDLAVGDPAPIYLTYRQYLASDPTTPQYIADGLTIKKVSAGMLRITATAGFEDFLNKAFPVRVYSKKDFPGLDR